MKQKLYLNDDGIKISIEVSLKEYECLTTALANYPMNGDGHQDRSKGMHDKFSRTLETIKAKQH